MNDKKTAMPVRRRDANLDLLRIISMFLIVLLHSVDHSGVLEHARECGAGIYMYVQYIYALTQVCVNCFVMLSGYYLVKSTFRVQKLIALWLEVVFYSVVLRVIFMAIGYKPFSIVSLASCFFPILTGRYWFMTIYVGLYLLSPFLNAAIHAMSKRQLTGLNLLLFVLLSAWVSIHRSIAGMNSGAGWGLTWFVALYLAAAWFRLYYQPSGKKAMYLVLFFAIPAVMALGFSQWYRYDSAPVYIATLCLFAALLNTRIENPRAAGCISAIAPLTFGVYLIHAHADVSPWSWSVLNLPQHMHTVMFPLVQIAAVAGIFAVCAAIDWARKKTVGRVENSAAVHAVSARIETHIRLLMDRAMNKLGEE